MILIDAKLLLYAYDSSSPRHLPARAWLEKAFSNPETVGLPWATVMAFLRISTNPRAFLHPLSMLEATGIVSSWFQLPNVTLAAPTDRHWDVLRSLLVGAQANGPLASDAHLAALAVEHGAMLCTCDRDFSRFEGLKTLDPLR